MALPKYAIPAAIGVLAIGGSIAGYKGCNAYKASQAEQAQQDKDAAEQRAKEEKARIEAEKSTPQYKMKEALKNGIVVSERYVLPRNIDMTGKKPGEKSYVLVLKGSNKMEEYSFPLADINEAYKWVNAILPGDTIASSDGKFESLTIQHAKNPYVPVGQTLKVSNPELIQVSQLNGPVSELVATLFAESVPYLPGTQTLQLQDGMSSEDIASAKRTADAETKKYQMTYMLKVTFSNPADQKRIVANLRKGYIFRIRSQDGSDSIVKVDNDNGREVYYVPSSRIVMEDGQVYDNSAITARAPIKLTREAPKPVQQTNPMSELMKKYNAIEWRVDGVETRVDGLAKAVSENGRKISGTQTDLQVINTSMDSFKDDVTGYFSRQNGLNGEYKDSIGTLQRGLVNAGTDLSDLRTQAENQKAITKNFLTAKYGARKDRKEADKMLKAIVRPRK